MDLVTMTNEITYILYSIKLCMSFIDQHLSVKTTLIISHFEIQDGYLYQVKYIRGQ
jgi:hypothetical protein